MYAWLLSVFNDTSTEIILVQLWTLLLYFSTNGDNSGFSFPKKKQVSSEEVKLYY